MPECAGRDASGVGFDDGPPFVLGARVANSRTGLPLTPGRVTALNQCNSAGRGQTVTTAMQDAALNLSRIHLLGGAGRSREGSLRQVGRPERGLPP